MAEIRVTTYDGDTIEADAVVSRVVTLDGGIGVDGQDGASAYELAVAGGFVGTEAEWLASLKGDPGDDADATAAIEAHRVDTTDVHGIADTSALVATIDPRLSDARTPTAHTHDDRYYTETEVDTQLGANATADRARANHTGTQTSATISDFTEAVQDAVAALLAAGTAISLAYDDAGNSLTITGTGGSGGLDAEAVRDAIGVALIGSGVISVTANDAADTITISTTATANSTDAQLRDRSTHTGTQSASTITGLAAVATSGAYADLVSKPAIPDSPDDIGAAAATHTHAQADVTGLSTTLAGKADTSALTAHAGNTSNPHAVTKTQVGLANVPNVDATSRANHTGTQAASTVTVTPTGSLAATDVQAALAELDAETKIITLAGTTAIPAGTPAGTIIARY